MVVRPRPKQRHGVTVTGTLAATAVTGDGSGLTGIEGVPSGVIAMWSGTVANVPSGWNICDGTNSTPDLRERFIVGSATDSGATYDVGDTGGGTATLTEDNLPSHAHGAGNFATDTAGAHAYFVRTHHQRAITITTVTRLIQEVISTIYGA